MKVPEHSSLPVRLTPRFYDKVWGDTALEPWFESHGRKIGEVWFHHEPELPILMKFIFTSERLSVQVHPDDAYAATMGLRGKTEMWHILRAGPGAAIAFGLKQAITAERAREAALSGEIEHMLNWLPVRAGDTIFTPPGTIHAIGAGLVLCEIQQQSDVTFRLYDYGRPRELHLNRALDVATLGPPPPLPDPYPLPDGAVRLASCRYFVTDAIAFSGHWECARQANEDTLLIAVEGAGWIAGQPCRAGEAWLIPAGTGAVDIRADRCLRLLRTYVP